MSLKDATFRIGTLSARLIALGWIALLFGNLAAHAGPTCDRNGRNNGDVVALFTKYVNFSDENIDYIDNDIIKALTVNLNDSTYPLAFCFITQEMFPALITTDLYNKEQVRHMLMAKSATVSEAVSKELIDFNVRYLVFMRFDGHPEQMQAMAVYIDRSERYEHLKFTPYSPRRPGDNLIVGSIDAIGALIRTLREEIQIPTVQVATSTQFPVVITCFADHIAANVPLPEGYNRESLTIELSSLLAQNVTFGDLFPVQFESTCSQRTAEEWKEAMERRYRDIYGAEHWFVWRGEVWMPLPSRMKVKIQFLHYLEKTDAASRLKEWNVNPEKSRDLRNLPQEMPRYFQGEWCSYVKALRRPELVKAC